MYGKQYGYDSGTAVKSYGSDLISGIKRFDQLIHIMFKISVPKQNANLIQMDYTSFRNQ